jgi:hypothetical protein
MPNPTPCAYDYVRNPTPYAYVPNPTPYAYDYLLTPTPCAYDYVPNPTPYAYDYLLNPMPCAYDYVSNPTPCAYGPKPDVNKPSFASVAVKKFIGFQSPNVMGVRRGVSEVVEGATPATAMRGMAGFSDTLGVHGHPLPYAHGSPWPPLTIRACRVSLSYQQLICFKESKNNVI